MIQYWSRALSFSISSILLAQLV